MLWTSCWFDSDFVATLKEQCIIHIFSSVFSHNITFSNELCNNVNEVMDLMTEMYIFKRLNLTLLIYWLFNALFFLVLCQWTRFESDINILILFSSNASLLYSFSTSIYSLDAAVIVYITKQWNYFWKWNPGPGVSGLFILLSCLVSIYVSENVFYIEMWHSVSDHDVNILAEGLKTIRNKVIKFDIHVSFHQFFSILNVCYLLEECTHLLLLHGPS